jgi:hypothetical protein
VDKTNIYHQAVKPWYITNNLGKSQDNLSYSEYAKTWIKSVEMNRLGNLWEVPLILRFLKCLSF